MGAIGLSIAWKGSNWESPDAGIDDDQRQVGMHRGALCVHNGDAELSIVISILSIAASLSNYR